MTNRNNSYEPLSQALRGSSYAPMHKRELARSAGEREVSSHAANLAILRMIAFPNSGTEPASGDNSGFINDPRDPRGKTSWVPAKATYTWTWDREVIVKLPMW